MPDVTMVLSVIVLLVAVTVDELATRQLSMIAALLVAACLPLPLMVLLFMFSVVGLPPVISVMLPVPAVVLLVTVLLLMFTVAAEAELVMPVNVPVVAVA